MTRAYRNRGAIGYWIAVTVVAVGLAWVILLVINLQQQAEDASTVSQARQEAVDVLAEDVRTLRQQVEASGEEPAAPDPKERVEDLPDADDEPVLIPGPRGDRGPAPTAAQVRQAVDTVLSRDPDMPESQVMSATVTYLTANPPADGDDGSDGEPGRAPTPDEIAVAVAAYCADGACRGADGSDGDRGPGPTDEQIAAAVAMYCNARGECRGAPGRDGADGEDGRDGRDGTDGSDGRGIVGVDCNDDADLVITYDQPPITEVIEGPCRIDTPDEPDVEPTDTPTTEPTEG